MGIEHGRSDGARINSDTCFVLAYHPIGTAPDRHGKGLAKLTPIEAKLDLLLKAARLEYDPLGNLGDVVKAVQAGQKIEAIKRYREVMSVSLAKAKSVVEEAQRRAGL